jgi:hypothetical protein
MVFLVFSGRSGIVGYSILAYASPQLGGLDQNQKFSFLKQALLWFRSSCRLSMSIDFHPGEIRGGCALSVWRTCFSWATLH